MKKIVLFLFLVVSACAGNTEPHFDSQLHHQPYVTGISPDPSQVQNTIESIKIIFSEELNSHSINNQSLAIASVENIRTLDASVLWNAIEDHKQPIITGEFTLSENKKEVLWHPSQTLEEGNIALLISPSVESSTRIPFNQHPGEAPAPLMFIFQFSRPFGNLNTLPPSPTSRSPVIPSTPLHRPSFILINEIFYDSLESDTDGHAFIELFGEPEKDIEGYQVVLINGSDGAILDTITIPTGKKTREDGLFLIADARTNLSNQSFVLNPDFIDNFDPQNGSDSAQLLDDQGHLLDAITYGSGAVTGARNGLATGEGSPALDVSAGHSLSRVTGATTHENSQDFIDLSTPTPGEL